MKIKAVCKTHPTFDVYLLEATTRYLTPVGDVQHSNDSYEDCNTVILDEHNLYCTADDNYGHEVGFEVVEEDRTCPSCKERT